MENIDEIIDKKITEKFKELIKKNKSINLKSLLDFNFDNDFDSILNVFKDEDTTIKVISTLNNSDIKTKIIVKILLNK